MSKAQKNNKEAAISSQSQGKEGCKAGQEARRRYRATAYALIPIIGALQPFRICGQWSCR